MKPKTPKPRYSAATISDLKKSLGKGAEEDAIRLRISDVTGGYKMPYHNDTDYARVRSHQPRKMADGSTMRYSQPKGSAPELYIPPLGDFDWADVKPDAGTPLYITEGEKKAAAMCKVGLPTVGIGGVDCWASKGSKPLPQWGEFQLRGRDVYIVFDSDIVDKPAVRAAEGRLARFLASQGAKVYRVRLDQGAAK